MLLLLLLLVYLAPGPCINRGYFCSLPACYCARLAVFARLAVLRDLDADENAAAEHPVREANKARSVCDSPIFFLFSPSFRDDPFPVGESSL